MLSFRANYGIILITSRLTLALISNLAFTLKVAFSCSNVVSSVPFTSLPRMAHFISLDWHALNVIYLHDFYEIRSLLCIAIVLTEFLNIVKIGPRDFVGLIRLFVLKFYKIIIK